MSEKDSEQSEVDWVCVDASLTWEERIKQFPLGHNQQYKYVGKGMSYYEVVNENIGSENAPETELLPQSPDLQQ
jgi:hypothetical protein